MKLENFLEFRTSEIASAGFSGTIQQAFVRWLVCQTCSTTHDHAAWSHAKTGNDVTMLPSHWSIRKIWMLYSGQPCCY